MAFTIATKAVFGICGPPMIKFAIRRVSKSRRKPA